MPKKSEKYGVPDAENPEWTKEDFAKSMRFDELPPNIQRMLSQPKRGAQKAPTKVRTSIPLSQDVLQGLRATGPGWQARADDALREWINSTKQAKAA